MTMGDELLQRYSRLIRAMRGVSHLTKLEAVGALVEYKIFGMRENFGSKAVIQLGGQLAAIRHGIQHRH